MDELKLLKDYVATMQRQVDSKNQQIRTLTEQNQQLLHENHQILTKSSYSLSTSNICSQCPKTKSQLANLHQIYNLLQLKYDNLSKQYDNVSKQKLTSSTVRVINPACSQCTRVKSQNQDLKNKYQDLQNKYQELQNTKQSLRTSTTKVYSTLPCTQCPKLRTQIAERDNIISSLKNQLSNFNLKILTLEGQINTLNATAPKTTIYTQQVSKQSDIQRISYLNSQIQQYIALNNSLRSEIKQINDENQRYIFHIRELQNRPRQVQLIEKQLSIQVIEEMKALRIQVGELSNDNILLRRQNAALKRQIMNLQLPRSQVIVQVEKPAIINQERRGRHYRKSNTTYQWGVKPSMQQMPYQQRQKYEDITRKIQLLQMENDYLRGTFYSEI